MLQAEGDPFTGEKSEETNPEIVEMVKLADKEFKIAFKNMHKDVWKNLTMMRK